MLKYEKTEVAKVQRGKVGVERAYEVLVEPLRFFYLEAYSFDGLKLLKGKVDYETHTQVIQPY